MAMVAQYCECAKRHWLVHLKMVKPCFPGSQWLGPRTPTAGGPSSVPHATWCGKKERKKMAEMVNLLLCMVVVGGLVAQSCPSLEIPWTVAHQAPLSMGFSRREYWSDLPFPSPGDLPDPGIKPRSPALQADSLLTELQRKLLKLCYVSVQFSSSVVSDSLRPMDCSTPGLPVHHQLLEFTQLMSIESVMPSNHLILCHPLLLPRSIFSSIRVFSNESVLCIRRPTYWSFSFGISFSNAYSGQASFGMDRLDLLAVQGTVNSLPQHHSSEASVLWRNDLHGKRILKRGCMYMYDWCTLLYNRK